MVWKSLEREKPGASRSKTDWEETLQAEPMWDFRGSGFHGQESPRDSRQLGMKSRLVRREWGWEDLKSEPTLNFVEMLGQCVESQRIWEITQIA